MTTENEEPLEVNDEETDKLVRLSELNKRTDLNDDEKKELTDLKEYRKTRSQKRIDVLTSRAKEAEFKVSETQRALDEKNREIEELRKTKTVEPDIRARRLETVEYNGKKFYTDEALATQVKSGELDDSEAYRHQRQRDKEEIKMDITKDFEQKKQESEFSQIRNEDKERVNREYPHFNATHPDHNPNDPLFKEVCRIWDEGYKHNPRGLSKAIIDAKRILRMDDQRPDPSRDMNTYSSRPGSSEITKKTDDVVLEVWEQEAAIKQFCRGDFINPKTSRAYTEKEALEKARRAKQSRAEYLSTKR